MENVWLLQLPEKQLVLLRAIKLTMQRQRLDSSVLNCVLVDKTDALFVGAELQALPSLLA